MNRAGAVLVALFLSPAAAWAQQPQRPSLNAGDEFYGLLYMFDPAGTVPRLISNGNAHLHGAIIAHDGVDLQLTGGFALEYDAAVLGALSRNTSSRGLTRLPGSWSDVQL